MILLLTLAAIIQQSTPGYFEPVREVVGTANSSLGILLDGGQHLDQDGVPDFIVQESRAIGAYSGASGALLFSIPTPYTAGYSRVLMLGDTDGDGASEILRTVFSTRMAHVHSGAGGALLYSITGTSGYFGFAAAVIGDVTGDGVSDFLISDPDAQAPGGGGPRGLTLLHSGWDGSLVRFHSILDYGSASAAGRRVSAAGDVDRDGTPDYLIGTPFDANSRGSCRIFSGATGTVLRILSNPNPAEDWFGSSVAFAGDCDADGVPDQAVVTPYAYGNLPLVSVFAGADGRLLWEAVATRWYGFGAQILGGWDWNGDGYEDLVTGEPVYLTADGRNGAVHLLSGRDGSVLASRYGEIAPDRYAYQLAWLGDLDSDGRPEFGVSSWEYADPIIGANAGRVQAFSWYPGLTANTDRRSASQGGSVNFTVNLPRSLTGEPFALLASATGTGPTTFRGVSVPLTPDAYLARAIAGSTPFLSNATGRLDAQGDAHPRLTLTPGAASGLVGSTLWFAAIAGSRFDLRCSTVATRLTILP